MAGCGELCGSGCAGGPQIPAGGGIVLSFDDTDLAGRRSVIRRLVLLRRLVWCMAIEGLTEAIPSLW